MKEISELNKALEISLHGTEAAEAIQRARKQIAEWGLVMPNVAPLVLDFGLGQFREIGEIEYWIANEIDGGYCGKFLFVFDGQTCPTHCHKQKLETFYIVKGSMRVTYDGGVRILEAGDTLLVETGKLHSFTGNGPALLLEVSRPIIIDDNYFENTNIPIGGNFRGA